MRGGSARRDWKHDLRLFLALASTQGRTQRDTVFRFNKQANADQITAELNFLHAQNKVQKFEVGNKGRTKVVWRATVKILDDVSIEDV